MSGLSWGFLRVAVDTAIRWPADETVIEFGGHEITLSPESDELLPTMMVKYDGAFTKDDAFRLLSEFTTAVAWAEGLGVNLTYTVAASTPGLWLHRPNQRGHVGPGRFDYLPNPPDQKTKLALALFREALTVNLIPYQFLAFYRVINLHVPGNWKQQVAWINAELPAVQDREAAKRLSELAASGQTDVGEYLHYQGRCAAAHASLTAVTINPDDPSDSVRLHCDLPIVRALGTRIIEHHLGVKTQLTYWRERTPRAR